MTFMQKLTAALVLFGLFASIYLLNEGAPISATAVNTGLIVVLFYDIFCELGKK